MKGEGESLSMKWRRGVCGREMKSLCEREGESVGERGREYGRGGRVRMVVEEGECMGKGGSFKGRRGKR